MSNIQINGLEAITRKIDALGKPHAFNTPMKEATQYMHDGVSEYPNGTEANQPRGFNTVYSIKTGKPNNTWYQRGYGSKRVRKDGSVTGRRTSQTLGKRWTSSVTPDGRLGRVGNNAKYARYVQGKEQAGFHRGRGWTNAPEWADKHSSNILKIFERHYQRLLR